MVVQRHLLRDFIPVMVDLKGIPAHLLPVRKIMGFMGHCKISFPILHKPFIYHRYDRLKFLIAYSKKRTVSSNFCKEDCVYLWYHGKREQKGVVAMRKTMHVECGCDCK
jgi:hypothetical protein